MQYVERSRSHLRHLAPVSGDAWRVTASAAIAAAVAAHRPALVQFHVVQSGGVS